MAVLAVYLLLYGSLLIWTGGLPYVSDNNESFSVFWHAQNMATQDFFKSYWLTDESFSPHAAAHPFVHTHQGNMPRLFGVVLYALGARTIEAQIVLTALTLGTLCVFLMYHALARIGGVLFGLVTSLAFLTDYIFYAQWHIVTYRVWHGIFLFGGLVCAERVIRSGRPRRWLALSWLTFAGLFYYELIFVAFVSLFCAFYALAIGWRSPKRVVLFGTMQALGGLTALLVLTTQLVGYLGWEGLKQDIYLTFVARNFADPDLQAQVAAFYQTHNVAFWKNVLDSTPYRRPQALVFLVMAFHLQLWTPVLAASVLMVVAGWLLGLLGWPSALAGWLRGRFGDGWAAILPRWSWPGPGLWSGRGFLHLRAGPATARAAFSFDTDVGGIVAEGAWWALRVIPLTLAGHAALVRIVADRAFLAVPSTVPPSVWLRVSALLFLVALTVTVLGLLACRRAGAGPTNGRPELGRVVLATVFLLAVTQLISQHPYVYRLDNFSAVWQGALQARWPILVLRGAFVAAMIAGAALTLVGSRRLLGGAPWRSLAPVAVLLGCGFLALAVVYVLATGYVITGYIWRSAPLWVFVIDIMLGACATVVVLLAARAVGHLWATLRLLPWRREPSGAPGQALAGRVVTRLWREPGLLGGLAAAGGVAAVAGFLCLFAVGYWVWVQRSYVQLLPPDHFRVLKLLRQPPYQGASFVGDMFAGPTAAQTGQWAYFDPIFGAGKVQETPEGFVVERDLESYLWFADRRENPAYLRPQYFLCLRLQDVRSVLARLIGKQDLYNTRCSDLGIVKQIDTQSWTPLQHQVVARDTTRDSWVIIKLDWEFAPYLVPWPDGHVIRLGAEPSGADMAIRVEYQYGHQDGRPEQGTEVEVYGRQPDGSIVPLGALEGPGLVLLPKGFSGSVWATVTPRTAERTGRAYVSDEIVIGADEP